MKVFATLLVATSANLLNTPFDQEENNLKRLRALCPCADSALENMAVAMYAYKNAQQVNPNEQNEISKLVQTIKDIAYECTRRPECRCPEGYYKTRDGTECLKFSEVDEDCEGAERACADDFNSRLAIAKDHRQLTKIADIMSEQDPFGMNYYWIGLSYNRTQAGLPVWTWVDGTRASSAISGDLNMDVKKSGVGDTRILDIEQGVPFPVERVAISSNGKYHGKVWKHESCRASGYHGPPKHRYICEFLMFKVKINAENKDGRKVGKVGEY
jgi:hypothetical protein